MDFETMQYDKDFDTFLKVRMDNNGGIDWISDIKTNLFLNECYNQLISEEKIELLDYLEISLTTNKQNILESNERIKLLKKRNDENDAWLISQHQYANTERKKKLKFIKVWIKKKKTEINNIEENIDQQPLIDLGNVKIAQKIIYLHELGIIKSLSEIEPFNTSINLLASALSAITGDKAETIQSYINPIFSKGTSQKNNPLTRINSVEKVRESLINLGFKPQH